MVLIDGKRCPSTPCRLTRRPGELFHLAASLKGYLPYDGEVRVTGDLLIPVALARAGSRRGPAPAPAPAPAALPHRSEPARSLRESPAGPGAPPSGRRDGEISFPTKLTNPLDR